MANYPKSPVRQEKPLVGVNVLIVEDEMMLAWSLCDIVSELGGNPTTAFSFNEALYRIEAQEFDCAVLDINLSGALSFPIAEILQAREIPFLFCSAYYEASKAFRSDVVAPFLSKPVKQRDLRDALLGLIKKQSPDKMNQ